MASFKTGGEDRGACDLGSVYSELCLENVLVTFLITVMKRPERINRKGGGFFGFIGETWCIMVT